MSREPESAAEGVTWTDVTGDTWTVGAKCSDTSAPGHWVCTTHGEAFAHNMAMQSHVSDGAEAGAGCVIAWHCHVHGPEVP